MTKVDLEKVKVAIVYMDRMASGKHPLSNTKITEKAELNDPNIIRCLFFIRDLLKDVQENNGEIGAPAVEEREKVLEKPFPFEVLQKFSYRRDQTITHVLDQFKMLARDPAVKAPSYRPVLNWLREEGFLRDDIFPSGQRVTKPTELGRKFGLYTEHRSGFRGEEYDVVMYNRNAQEFLAKNLEAITFGDVIDLSYFKEEKKGEDLSAANMSEAQEVQAMQEVQEESEPGAVADVKETEDAEATEHVENIEAVAEENPQEEEKVNEPDKSEEATMDAFPGDDPEYPEDEPE